MKCSVTGCNNNTSDKSSKTNFLLFPSNPAVAKKWLTFCQRPESFNYRYCLVCKDHFVDEDFENLVQYKMGFANHIKLKRGAVPTVRRVSPEPSVRKQRHERRQQKQLVTNLIKEYGQEKKEKPLTICSEFGDQYTEGLKLVKKENKIKPLVSINKYDEQSSEDNIQKEIKFEEVEVGNNFHYAIPVYEEVEELRAQIKRMCKENMCLRKINKGLVKKLEKWKKLNIQKDMQYASRVSKVNVQLKNKTQECHNLEQRLKVIFTSGQINKMKSPATAYHWNDEDITKSVTLYTSSGKTYKLLYDNGFPLPSVRTLQRWKYDNKMVTSKDVNENTSLPEAKIEPVTIVEQNIIKSENIILETSTQKYDNKMITRIDLNEPEIKTELEDSIEPVTIIEQNIIKSENIILETSTQMDYTDEVSTEYSILLDVP